jgi:phospholipid/cholesterol/gamma-HCH transport system substrate-binding protein
VMPELGRLLRNQVTTGNTVVEKEEELRALFNDVAGFSDTTRDFLEVNDENIIRLGEVSVPNLGLLERYSPEYPCLAQGMANWIPRMSQGYRGYTLHINLETIPHQPTGYRPADQPEYGADYGPTCASLPTPPYSQADPGPQPSFLKQSESDDGIAGSHGKYRVAPGFGSAGVPGATSPAAAVTSGWAGTEAEQKVVDAVAAPVLGVRADRVPDVATLLLGPIARGNEVSVR